MSNPTTIDLSRVPAPDALEAINFETLNDDYKARFQALWAVVRADNPELPDYDVAMLETDPAIIIGEAFNYLRLLDHARVNQAVRAVLAPTAKGADLDNIAARVNIARLTGETDAQLLRRYLLAHDRPSAGSRDRYLFEAWTAWPQMHDAAVIGRSVHGRRGEVDLVIIGPGGRAPTNDEMAAVRTAVNADGAKPEATAVNVLAAKRALYAVDLLVHLPQGPDPNVIKGEIVARVTAAASKRMRVGAEVPADAVAGAAYGDGVVRVTRRAPTADLLPDPYTIPVMTGVVITTEVRS